MTRPNVLLVQKLYDHFRLRDLAGIVALTTEDFEVVQSEEVPWGGTHRGAAGMKEFFGILTGLLDNALQVERYIDAGDHVVVIARTRGLVRATGKTFDIPVAHLWEIHDGKAASFRPYIDNPVMLAALRG